MLGLYLDGRQLKGGVVHRSGSRLRIRKSFHAVLSLDPLSNDPELVGREIREHLTSQGIHENHCVVCIPLKWALTTRTALPDLPEADINSYLRLQAEREFPFSPEDLSISVSRFTNLDGSTGATIAAVANKHLNAMRKAFKAARLRPVSITLGTTSLHTGRKLPSEGTIAMHIGEDGIELQVTMGGGVAALRALDDALIDGPEGKTLDAEAIVKEIRITLGHLAPDVRSSITKARIFGRPFTIEPLVNELRRPLGLLGIEVEVGGDELLAQFDERDMTEVFSFRAFSAAARRLLGKPAEFEFLPPTPSRLKQIAGRVSSRGVLWLGGTAALVILGAAGALTYQYWRLSALEAEWSEIEPTVVEVQRLQDQVRKFRPWFDDSIRSLDIARKLTEVFPEEGTVWAKVVEINEQTEVHCSGSARTNRAWLDMLDRLRAADEVQQLKVQQIRGESPLQFTFSFEWSEGGSDES